MSGTRPVDDLPAEHAPGGPRPARVGDRAPRAVRGLALPAAVWALTRIGLVLSLTVPTELRGTGDVGRYRAVADALLRDAPVALWEYPVGALGVVLPPAVAGRSFSTYLVAFVALAVALDFLALVGILTCGETSAWNTRGGWLWVLGVPALGVLSLTRLDVAACALAALGVAALHRRGPGARAGVLLTAGALVKVWPGVVLAVAVGAAGRRSRPLLAAGVLTVAVVVAVAWAAGLGRLLPDFLQYQGERGIQLEALAALPLLWLDRLGLVGYDVDFSFGAQQVSGPGTGTIAVLAPVATLVGLSVLGLLLVARRRRGDLSVSDVTLFATAAVTVLVLTNKVFSPQYVLWLLVLYALMAHSRETVPTRAGAALLAVAVLTHVAFPYLYADLIERELLPLLVLTVRDGVLVYLAVDLSARLRQVTRAAPAYAPSGV